MKELNRKVFITIFTILTSFVVICITIYNIESYKIEYENIKRNLVLMEEKNNFKPNNDLPEQEFDDFIFTPRDRDIDNMMIMDYEVYTVKINDKEIEKIINHSGDTSDFNIKRIAKSILKEDKGIHIGNLYNNKYSYNYTSDTITIINTESTNNRLLITLAESLAFIVIVEIIIYFITQELTRRITQPAQDSFDKQKDFIADASHELKSDKKNAKYIENIKYESERMNTLIKGLLDLSKLENGVSKSTYKDENISKIIEKTSLTLEGVAFEKNVSIDTNIEDNLIFKCSKEEIEKLITIIIDNAIKHSYKDSTIKVNANKEKNNVVISITNSGDPIKPGDEEKIFERFYRADKSRNREANRYGLGLAIAKNIVTNHNGTIKASSNDGLTTFKIILKK